MEQDLTVAGAARKLDVTLDSIYRLIYAGKLPARKERRHWVIPSSAIDARIKAREASLATPRR